METSTRYKCAQLLLMVREHMRIARPVNESEILDKMEAFLRFPLLAPDFHECSECSDQPCSCCNNAPKQGEWKPGDTILFRNCGQRDEGKFVMKIREWFVIDMDDFITTANEKYIIHETKLDLELKDLLLRINPELTPHGIEMSSAELKSLFTVKMPEVTEREYKERFLLLMPNHDDVDAAWLTFQHFNNQNQGK